MSIADALKLGAAIIVAMVLAFAIMAAITWVVLLPFNPICAEPWQDTTALYFTTYTSKHGANEEVAVKVDGHIVMLRARSTDTVGCKIKVRRRSSIFGWNARYERNPEPDTDP